jgi:hypothetical protein
MSRFGSALANGVRQYAVSIDNAAWYQLESQTGGLVAATGLAASTPVIRWRGQVGTGTDAANVRNPWDYTQGILIQNTHGSLTLYLTTTDDQTGLAPASRTVANAIAIGPGGSLKLDNTDATKIYLRASGAGPIIAAVLAT